MNAMHPLAALFGSGPMLISEGWGEQANACLNMLAREPRLQELLGEHAANDDGFWPAPDDWRAGYRPYVVVDGTLHIPVRGFLTDNFPWAMRWATGYEYIQRAFERGMDDGTVQRIAFIVNSGGGLVAKNFDMVDKLFARRGEKPVAAFAAEFAYSAAYSIASLADPGNLWVTRTGGVGSIGVMTAHIDWSKWNEEFGIAYTFIHYGKHKVDGNAEEPLPADVKARMQKRIDGLGEMFVAIVARNRGIEEAVVRATEALTFSADEAVSNGLADQIGSLDDALAAFAADLSQPSEGDEEMSTKDESAVDRAAHDAAVTAADQAGFKRGTEEATTAERDRITALIDLDAESSLSEGAVKAIADGTDAGAFAIGLAKAAKIEGAAALAAAKSDAATTEQIPPKGDARGAGTEEQVNRGAAAVDHLRGKVRGLPARA